MEIIARSMFDSEGHLWLVWVHMRERCRDSNHPSYNRYGGRGIEVEEPWLSDRHAFYNWAENSGYSKGLQLDRINNDGNYSAVNCRWATRAQNMQNTSRTLKIEIDGEVKTKSEWMKDERVKIGYGTFYKRKARGWSDRDALFVLPDARYARVSHRW